MALRENAKWYVLAAAIIAADQATKQLLELRTPEHWMREVMPGFFRLVHRHNPGIAFGLLADGASPVTRTLLIAFAFLVISLLVWLIASHQGGNARTRAGLALILGGAGGNLLDRLLHGSVIDFVELYVNQYHWPAFNVADTAISIGATLVIWELLFERRVQPEDGADAKT